MPYLFTNEEFVARLYNGGWASVSSVNRLVQTMRSADYSVVESRRTAHRTLVQWIDDMAPAPFDREVRFPGRLVDRYVTTADTTTDEILTSLASVLSYRATNVAKDIEVGKGAQKDKETGFVAEQGLQDNVKRFEELVKALARLTKEGETCWSRSSFETTTGSAWEAPAAPGGG